MNNFNIFENWLIRKYTNYLDVEDYNRQQKMKWYCTYDGNDIYLYTYRFGKWIKLLRKYTHEKLINYFMEVVRKELPELKGTKLIFCLNGEKEISKII